MNKVFIATSLDGYIADINGSVDFLNEYPDPVNEDMGYHSFIESIDALIMGSKTFETILGFGIDWPYTKPVYVVTSQERFLPEKLIGKVSFINGSPQQIISQMLALQHKHLYIDGGRVIQSFLQENLIDEMIITTVPCLLGSGVALFGSVSQTIFFSCIETKTFSNGLVQCRYVKRNSTS